MFVNPITGFSAVLKAFWGTLRPLPRSTLMSFLLTGPATLDEQSGLQCLAFINHHRTSQKTSQMVHRPTNQGLFIFGALLIHTVDVLMHGETTYSRSRHLGYTCMTVLFRNKGSIGTEWFPLVATGFPSLFSSVNTGPERSECLLAE